MLNTLYTHERVKQRREDTPAIAITAASGRLGHAIANALAAEGLARNTRLAARNLHKLRLEGIQHFDVVSADYENGRSMVAAFSGIDTAFIISSMGPDTTRIRQHRIAIDAAIAAGVKRIIYTSSANAMQSGTQQWTYAHADTENYLRRVGIPHTILRVGAYFSNFDYLFAMAMQCKRLFFPDVMQPLSLITQEDVAAAALTVLNKPGYDKKSYDILAKNAVSMTDLARIIGRISGTQIMPAPIPVDAFVTELRKHPIPDYAADLIGAFYTAIAKGACARTSKDMETLTGRPATSATAYLNAFINTYAERNK